MAAPYPSSHVRDDAPTALCFRESMPSSLPKPTVQSSNMMLYLDPEQQQNNHVIGMDSPPHQQEILHEFGGSGTGEHGFDFWRDNRNEMLLTHPSSVFQNMQNLQGQGLSLCLHTQIPSGTQMLLTDCSFPSIRLASFLSHNPTMIPGGGDENITSIEIMSAGFGNLGNARNMPKSRYLKAVQQLLDEVVNLWKALKHPTKDLNDENRSENKIKIAKEGDEGDTKDDPAASVQESPCSLSELSNSERQELQDKLSRLISMLDEVDNRYKQYFHQMHTVMQSFDSIAGYGASEQYTALALLRISHQFRCLRDAITGQIDSTRKSLGEKDASRTSETIRISRLRYIDQQLRQQGAIQQLGRMQQHAWRPQRGLPESSVSTLRAWLFEHFLHPYPKDSDKAMLAKQTGLTRGQVSNWFINARVRLWKPMVEEMYKEETHEFEFGLDSSSEDAAAITSNCNINSSEDKREDFEQPLCSKQHPVPHVDVGGRTNLQEGTCEDTENMEHNASSFCNMTELATINDRGRNVVSLTLGLQHHDGGHLPSSEATHRGMVAVGSASFYDTQLSSVAAESMEFEVINIKPSINSRG